MHVVLGATGHVGAAVADALLERGEAVTVVTRDKEKGESWRARGAAVAVLDLHDTDALRAAFRRARRAFLLNPPAPPSSDTDTEEHRSAEAIVAALYGSGLESVVAQSTYGAREGERIGDLSVLYDFETALGSQPIPARILRAAYYMSNWDMLLPQARDEGVLPTMLPADLRLPMVAPADIGYAAARLLCEPAGPRDVTYVEGPERYSPADVARAFAKALGRTVKLDVIPRERWVETYRAMGFSDEAADAYARMTAVSVDSGFAVQAEPERGATTLEDHVARLVAGN
ncbi:MAG: NmrA family NAD(P)-binding protein [Methylobacterium mesophilicum]|nr:NmrA family NAD(P)-binding protein [Methylobacterium mesophilicum]